MLDTALFVATVIAVFLTAKFVWRAVRKTAGAALLACAALVVYDYWYAPGTIKSLLWWTVERALAVLYSREV